MPYRKRGTPWWALLPSPCLEYRSSPSQGQGPRLRLKRWVLVEATETLNLPTARLLGRKTERFGLLFHTEPGVVSSQMGLGSAQTCEEVSEEVQGEMVVAWTTGLSTSSPSLPELVSTLTRSKCKSRHERLLVSFPLLALHCRHHTEQPSGPVGGALRDLSCRPFSHHSCPCTPCAEPPACPSRERCRVPGTVHALPDPAALRGMNYTSWFIGEKANVTEIKGLGQGRTSSKWWVRI